MALPMRPPQPPLLKKRSGAAAPASERHHAPRSARCSSSTSPHGRPALSVLAHATRRAEQHRQASKAGWEQQLQIHPQPTRAAPLRSRPRGQEQPEPPHLADASRQLDPGTRPRSTTNQHATAPLPRGGGEDDDADAWGRRPSIQMPPRRRRCQICPGASRNTRRRPGLATTRSRAGEARRRRLPHGLCPTASPDGGEGEWERRRRRRVLQPWHGLRIGSLQAEKLRVREEVHDSFPHAHGIYVQKVVDGSPAADSGIKAGDVITKLDDFALSNAQEFHELILEKAENALRHGEGTHFTVSVLRPSSGFELCATINAEVIDTNELNMSNQNKSKQNRWPVPKTKWLYPDDERDADMMPLVRKCHRPGYVYRAPLSTDVSRYTRL